MCKWPLARSNIQTYYIKMRLASLSFGHEGEKYQAMQLHWLVSNERK
jgi:hypothetical protein